MGSKQDSRGEMRCDVRRLRPEIWRRPQILKPMISALDWTRENGEKEQFAYFMIRSEG